MFDLPFYIFDHVTERMMFDLPFYIVDHVTWKESCLTYLSIYLTM